MGRAKLLEQFVKAWYHGSLVHACLLIRPFQGGQKKGLKDTNFVDKNGVQNQALHPQSGKLDIQDPWAYKYASAMW